MLIIFLIAIHLIAIHFLHPTISFPVCILSVSDGSQLHVFFHSQALYSVPLMPGQGKAALVSITIFWRGAMYIEGFFLS